MRYLFPLLMFVPLSVSGAVISYDDGSFYEVPEGYEVYVSEVPVFRLSRSDRQYRFEALLPAEGGEPSEADGLEVIRSEPLGGIEVDGYSRIDANGLSKVQRLTNVLTPYNDSILPEGRYAGFSNGYLMHMQFVGLAASEGDMSPDFGADELGDTIGGIGNTDPWYNDIFWSQAETAVVDLGDVVLTDAGDYQVVQAAEGQLALRPLDDALSPGYDYFFNDVMQGHHLGIHPETGVVWYQVAPCIAGELGSGELWLYPTPEMQPPDC